MGRCDALDEPVFASYPGPRTRGLAGAPPVGPALGSGGGALVAAAAVGPGVVGPSGPPLPGLTAPPPLPSLADHPLGDGGGALAGQASGSAYGRPPPPPDDVRTLAARHDNAGIRHRDVREYTSLMSEDAWPDFSIKGLRACGRVLRFMAEQGAHPAGGTDDGSPRCACRLQISGSWSTRSCASSRSTCRCTTRSLARTWLGLNRRLDKLQLVEERWRGGSVGDASLWGLAHPRHAVRVPRPCQLDRRRAPP